MTDAHSDAELEAIHDFRRLVMEILDREAAEPGGRQSDS